MKSRLKGFSLPASGDLYNLDPVRSELPATLVAPKDKLMAGILQLDCATYHDHDKILQNHEEEELSEVDKKAACADFNKNFQKTS